MADQLSVHVSEEFSLADMVEKMAEDWRKNGYTVTVTELGNSMSMKFEKDTGGLNFVMGMSVGVTATLNCSGGTLNVTYSNVAWDGKIIAFVIGWFICFIPIVTAIIGTVNQLDLPKKISSDVMARVY